MEAPLINGGGNNVEEAVVVDLHHAPTSAIDTCEGDYPQITTFSQAKSICWLESIKLWTIAGPIAFQILCIYGINSVTQIFVGHIGDVELSAVAIALSVISNFSFGFLLGMGSALETLCGQAFGAGQTYMLGIYMQRSWIILLVTRPEFSLGLIWALIFHVFLLWLFIYVFGWGTVGAAVAYNISGWIVSLAQVVYVVKWCTDGWKGLSWLAFKEIWAFVRLSLASAVMLCLEIWYMMVLVVLTGHLGDASDRSLVTLIFVSKMNINGWEGMLFIGINVTVSVRVSNELASGHPRAAKYSVMVVVLEVSHYWVVLHVSKKELQQVVARLAYLLGVTMVLNSIQPVISCGWQALVAYINLACYYIFGLPLGFLMGYKANLGVQGIWAGMLCGTALQTLVLLIIICKTNWTKEAEQASERVKMWGGSGD
ncbi:hypothetical protein MKW92_031174 [Papaver armeniacum]|nr:hypothetical protein MKW92_031174 [Papaver armeniacum]